MGKMSVQAINGFAAFRFPIFLWPVHVIPDATPTAAKKTSEQTGPLAGSFPSRNRQTMMEVVMLYWALVFLVVALIAGVFGFGGIASASAGIAQILFVIFLVLFIGALIMRAVR